MKQSLLFSIIMFAFILNAQNTLKVSYKPYNAGIPLLFNTTVEDLHGDAYNVSTFYYYISNIHVIHDGGQDLDLSDTVIIIKNEDFTFDFGLQNVTTIEQINFGVGVPQVLNHLDISTYPIGHPLSYQTPSMQWGWTSGYNQVGIVGNGDNNLDGNADTPFQLFPISDGLYKNIQLPASAIMDNGIIEIKIHTNLDQWLKNINLGSNGILHGSTGNNVTLMGNTQTYPVFTIEYLANISSIKESEGVINYSVADNSIEIQMLEFVNSDNYRIIDLNGRILKSGSLTKSNEVLHIDNISNGNYWFTVFSKDGNQLNNVRIIK